MENEADDPFAVGQVITITASDASTTTSKNQPMEPKMDNADKYPHYFKRVPSTVIDVYRVLAAFEVTDPCLAHAVKKLLVAGGRGPKCIERDVKEAIDTLERWKEMRKEERPGGVPVTESNVQVVNKDGAMEDQYGARRRVFEPAIEDIIRAVKEREALRRAVDAAEIGGIALGGMAPQELRLVLTIESALGSFWNYTLSTASTEQEALELLKTMQSELAGVNIIGVRASWTNQNDDAKTTTT